MTTLDAIIADVAKGGRVCPQPKAWDCLWGLLLDISQRGSTPLPPIPFILAAWWNTSDRDKRERFENQLRWANEHGAIDAVALFLSMLAPEEWHFRP